MLIGGNQEVVVLGKFNGRTGSQENDTVVGKHGELVINENGRRLTDFCNSNEYRITNGFYAHTEINKFMWIQRSWQLKSVTDYIIIKQKRQGSKYRMFEFREEQILCLITIS